MYIQLIRNIMELSNEQNNSNYKFNNFDKIFNSDIFYSSVEYLTFEKFINKYNGTEKRIKHLPITQNNTQSNINDIALQCVTTDLAITNINDSIYLTDKYLKQKIDSISETDMVYCIEPIPFLLSEIRLLVGNGKIYAHSNVNPNIDSAYILSEDIIKKILKLLGTDYVCIDIGLMYISTSNRDVWKVINIQTTNDLLNETISNKHNYNISLDQYTTFYQDVVN